MNIENIYGIFIFLLLLIVSFSPRYKRRQERKRFEKEMNTEK
jgi:hypothetical protein